MPSILPRFEKMNWLFNQVVLSALFFTGTAYSASPNIPDPSVKGPFDVGFVEFDIMVPSQFTGTDAVTQVTVQYPIPAGVSPSEPGPDTKYRLTTDDGSVFDVPSPINAVRNAYPAPGLFKMVVVSHSGGAFPAPDTFDSHQHIRNLETLASHGFVSLIFTRRAHGPDIFGDVDSAIDIAVQAAANHVIDGTGGALIPIYRNEVGEPDKMGIMGHSGGGFYVAQKTIGNDGIPTPDPRFAAAITLDTIGIESIFVSDEQLAATTVPYLQLRGSALDFIPFLRERTDAVFEKTTAVSPRYQLRVEYFDHGAPLSSSCDLWEIARHAALDNQVLAGQDPLLEPLDFTMPLFNDFLNFFVRLVWAGLDPVGGMYREHCATLGVTGDPLDPRNTDNHSIRNALGVQDSGPPDGINDYYTNFLLNPLAQANLPGVDLETAAMPIAGITEDFNELMARYQVSFFKVHLDNDLRYMPYLSPGLANQNPRVTLRVTGGHGGKIE